MSLQLGESPDYYRVLGLESGASENEIKQAYKKLAVKTHPDKNSGSDENFKLVGEAYNVLSNALERQKYDSLQLEAKMSRKAVTASAVRRKDPNILFYDAARNGDVAGLASGFKCGARVQWRNPADEGRTALHAAASCGHAQAVLVLISLGSDLEARNLYRDTPLHEGCAAGQTEAALALLRQGAPVGLENKYGATGTVPSPSHPSCMISLYRLPPHPAVLPYC